MGPLALSLEQSVPTMQTPQMPGSREKQRDLNTRMAIVLTGTVQTMGADTPMMGMGMMVQMFMTMMMEVMVIVIMLDDWSGDCLLGDDGDDIDFQADGRTCLGTHAGARKSVLQQTCVALGEPVDRMRESF